MSETKERDKGREYIKVVFLIGLSDYLESNQKRG